MLLTQTGQMKLQHPSERALGLQLIRFGEVQYFPSFPILSRRVLVL